MNLRNKFTQLYGGNKQFAINILRRIETCGRSDIVMLIMQLGFHENDQISYLRVMKIT